MDRIHPDDMRIFLAALIGPGSEPAMALEKADSLIAEARKDEMKRDAARRREQAMRGSYGSWINGLGQQWSGK